VSADLLTVRTLELDIACEASGDTRGFPVVLLHGFPDDVRAYDDVTPPLVAAGYRILVPYLRGYGPTRFRDDSTPRMAQQAAIGQDVVDLLDGLGLARAALAGYDWGGRAACIASLLVPDRIGALLTIGGYNVQNTIDRARPASPARERAYWYQWYFNTERGRDGLAANRRALCRALWREWSPTWSFDDHTFERTAASFDNADFVDVVIHSYRVRHRNAPADPRFDAVERYLATGPKITAPSTIMHGADDTVGWPRPADEELPLFPSGTERRVVPGGHFLPRENSRAVADALLDLLRRSA
jgi:pimeloyl-ACP methyl ester carboxylesterase